MTKIYTAKTIPTVAEIRRQKKGPVAISLFAGCGGSSTGLNLAGFDVRYANEFISIAADCYAANWPKTKLDRRDVRKVSAEAILKAIGKRRGEVDLMDASPPCKLYSQAARHARVKKNDDDEIMYSEKVFQRVDDLFDHAIRILKGVKPKAFTMENVVGLTQESSAPQFNEFLSKMRGAGYVVKATILDASWLGVPQSRRRVVFIGIRKDLKIQPPEIYPLTRQMVCQDVLPHAAKMHYGGKGYFSAQLPHPTITAIGFRLNDQSVMSTGGFIETADGERRKLTIPELIRLFGFPKDYKLIGKFDQKWERLGRSHAQLRVYYVASAIRKSLGM